MFRRIRISRPFERLYGITLNVFAEYAKYNCAYIHKGYITEDAVETAMRREQNEDLTT